MQKQTLGSATASLVLGILGMFLAIPAIPAIICGHVARAKIKRAPDVYDGGGMALAGLILGYLAIGLTILLIVASTMVVANLSGQSESARISATRARISAIGTAISVYETETSRLPDSLEQLTQSTEDRPGLLRQQDLRDSWGQPFQYRLTGRFEYEIRSAGPDQLVGTFDDVTN